MAVRDILQLGNPVLRSTCVPVRSFDNGGLQELVEDLRDTLLDFHARRGFGRGIAAPQIGILQRAIFVDVGEPMALLNPVIVGRSRKHILLWDDCFSFPDLMVKLKRHLTIEVRYRNLQGKLQTLKAAGGLSELLQHEIDHINGILAVDRAIDSKHIIYRSELEKLERRTEKVML
jgi:peptide deformylase